MKKEKKQESCHGCKQRESVIQQIQWMARRYAHGRATYAVSTYNDAIRFAQKLGMEFKPDPIDGLVEAKDAQFDKEWFAQDRINKGIDIDTPKPVKGCGWEDDD